MSFALSLKTPRLTRGWFFLFFVCKGTGGLPVTVFRCGLRRRAPSHGRGAKSPGARRTFPPRPTPAAGQIRARKKRAAIAALFFRARIWPAAGVGRGGNVRRAPGDFAPRPCEGALRRRPQRKTVTGKPPVPLQTKNKKNHPRVKRGVFNDRAKLMLLALRVQRVI